MRPNQTARVAFRVGTLKRPVLACSLALLLSACRAQPLLYDVAVSPEAITPNRDGHEDVTRISYSIGAPAAVTITLVAGEGAAHVLRAGKPRTPGEYELLFGGAVDGRMLPDGDYTMRFDAVPAELPRSAAPVPSQGDGRKPTTGPGASVSIIRPFSIRDADSQPIAIAGFTVQPEVFSPNQDGLDDRVTISYRLDEAATSVRVWLQSAAGAFVTDILEEKDTGDKPTAVGAHQYDYDAGVDADAPPPPNGDYQVVAEVADAAGNVTREERPLAIVNGGQPRAAIIGDVEWSAKVLPLGDTLHFTATVENLGDTPIRTRGPEPGFIYDNDITFNQTLPAGFLILARKADRSGVRHVDASHGSVAGVRVDLGTSDAPLASGRPLLAAAAEGTGTVAAAAAASAPVGADRSAAVSSPESGAPGPVVPADAAPAPPAATAPAAAIDVCGAVRDAGSPVGDADVYLFQIDGDNGVQTRTAADGAFCFKNVAVPAPYERTLARSPGAVRLGLEYDEKRTDIAYPYRWQLGDTAQLAVCSATHSLYLCLPPGAKVTITGGLTFIETPYRRLTNVYLSLQHEDVRNMHGPYGRTAITVEYAER